MKINPFKRVLSVVSVLTIAIGLVPQAVTAAPSFSSTGATAGESLQNPILISTMDQLIEEMEKNTKGETYYKLTDDVSHETSVLTITGSDWKTGDDGFTTVREPEMAQCVVGTGKKFLELDGYAIHYKNNVNFIHANNSKYYKTGTKYDSLTFFYLGEVVNLGLGVANNGATYQPCYHLCCKFHDYIYCLMIYYLPFNSSAIWSATSLAFSAATFAKFSVLSA